MRSLRPLLVLGALVAIGLPRPAAAAPKKRYHFTIALVTAAKDVPADKTADLLKPIQDQMQKAMAAHPQLSATLEGAPDPATDAKKFKAWLAKKKIANAYKVNVEVTAYEEELEDKDASLNDEKRLSVSLSLRMFGETIPDRKMGFTGEGSASIKQDVGKKLRPRDRQFVLDQAIEMAVDDALATSLKQLAIPPKTPKH